MSAHPDDLRLPKQKRPTTRGAFNKILRVYHVRYDTADNLPYKEYRLYQQGKVKVKRPTGKRRNGLPEYNYLWIDESEIQPKDILLDNYTAFDWRLEGEEVQISSN